jgi:hypothetical protein
MVINWIANITIFLVRFTRRGDKNYIDVVYLLLKIDNDEGWTTNKTGMGTKRLQGRKAGSEEWG